jgi:hypothetical protein
MKRLVLISLTVLMFLVGLFPVKVSADTGKLTAEQALRILQSVNPNIANYDIETHLVTFKDGSKPVYVTPKGENSQNGEVMWEYFIQQKGDLRGWFKLTPEKILSEKSRMLKESGIQSIAIMPMFANSGFASLTQYPQERCAWCGVAATESVLSGWRKYITRSAIAQKEYGYDRTSIPAQCDCSSSASGVSESAIAYALNGYIFNRWTSSYWYKVSHFYSLQDFINIIGIDVGANQAGVIFCGYTEYLPAWNHHHTVHYTALYGYNLDNSTVAYTDSANGLYKYCKIETSGGTNPVNYKNLPAYNSCNLNSYYQYAYPYPAVG